jgi:hypothetical protein
MPLQITTHVIMHHEQLSSMYFRVVKHRRYSDWLRAGRPRGHSSSSGGGKSFLFSTSSRQVEAHPASYQMDTEDSFSGRKADHSYQPNALVKNTGSTHPFPRTSSWRSAYLVKHSDNFTFIWFSKSSLQEQ